jgi:hypothetical protein
MRAFSKSYRRRHEPSMDALPEQMTYKDTGCEVAPFCLQCPLPQCKYDDPIWYQHYRRRGRDHLILAVHESDGATVFELAQRFHLSPRTIHRTLRRVRIPIANSA